MSNPSPEKLAEWKERASIKGAIVPSYFEVSSRTAILVCGNCGTRYQRNLVPRVDEPTFVCPNESCRAKNWVPLRYNLK